MVELAQGGLLPTGSYSVNRAEAVLVEVDPLGGACEALYNYGNFHRFINFEIKITNIGEIKKERPRDFP